MKDAIIVISFIVATILLMWAIKSGVDRHDQYECYKWQEYATEYPSFYLTQNEADQCAYWNIKVNASIK